MPISSINPATAEVLKTFDSLSEAELDAKLARAAEAFRRHRLTSFADRAHRMQRAAEILDDDKESLARTMTLEMGKPITPPCRRRRRCLGLSLLCGEC